MRSVSNLVPAFLLVVFFLVLSVIVGIRPESVGADTANYILFFGNISESIFYSRFEPVFKYLTFLIGSLTVSVEVYFAFLFLIFNFSYLAFYRYLYGGRVPVQGYLILIGFFLTSSWYVVATTNGLRQGLSLPILYFSIVFFSERRYLFASSLFLISLGFHKAGLLALPFVFLVFVRPVFVLIFFCGAGVLYFLGVTEIIVRAVSDVLSISLYDNIVGYLEGADNWVGFQPDFFVYTVFWGFFFYYLRRFVLGADVGRYTLLWKIYCALAISYFFFGFGPYSNRYAFMAWLLLPLMQAFFVSSCRMSGGGKFLFGFLLFFVGLFSYLYLLLNA